MTDDRRPTTEPMRATVHPTPTGTRDVLPDEMRELRRITERVRAVFDAEGYGEVWTPALEYEWVFTTGLAGRGEAGTTEELPTYRVFDEQGNVLVLRSDMTVPIARLVAMRYAGAELPVRLCYFAHAYRGVRPQRGHQRELLQAGIELIGAPSPHGTAEALRMLCAALDAAGLRSYRVGFGDASLYPALLEACGVPEGARDALLHELVTRDFVGLERRVRALGLRAPDAELLVRTPQLRGDATVLDQPDPRLAAALGGLRAVRDLLEPAVAARLLYDLGLVRQLGYYTGAVFEVYDPALGEAIGRGGRYDDLLARFGRPLPAVGFALNVERLHLAVAGEERSGAGAEHAGVERAGPGDRGGRR